MTNRHRGEIAAELGGQMRRLRLSLGALAELEAAYGAADLNALVQRFAQGRLAALDLVRIIGAGLRGAGSSVTDEEVAAMDAEGGALGLARIASELLAATFGGSEAASTNPPAPQHERRA